jgi:hypothetical protein
MERTELDGSSNLSGATQRRCWMRGFRLLVIPVFLTCVALAADKPEALIPFDKLDDAAQARVREVVPGYTFYRKVRLSRYEVKARYDLFEYLINHLDQTSIVAQPLKIVEYRSVRLPDGGYWADNRTGASGYLWPLLEGRGERVYFVQGGERGKKTVEGRAVVLLFYREKEPGVIAYELHAFVKVESWIKRMLAKLFLPFVTGTVDRRFGETIDVPVLVSEQATADPGKVVGVIDGLPPEDRAVMAEFRNRILRQGAAPDK